MKNYTYTIEEAFICIIDLDNGGKSVTNDIKNIIKEIEDENNFFLDSFKIVYRDSEGIWDAVILNSNGIRFLSLNVKTNEEAKEKYDIII